MYLYTFVRQSVDHYHTKPQVNCQLMMKEVMCQQNSCKTLIGMRLTMYPNYKVLQLLLIHSACTHVHCTIIKA